MGAARPRQAISTMSRPPVEKLPLVARKNLRDEWHNKRADLEARLSDVLGEKWSFEVVPNAIYAYHNDGWAKEGLGSCIENYFDGAVYNLKDLVERYADKFDIAKEINTFCPAHVLSLEIDATEPKRFSYNGCDIRDGKLRLLFLPEYLGTNVSETVTQTRLFDALNEASLLGGSASMSFKARLSIKEQYEPAIEEVRQKIARIAGTPEFKLDPNFEETYKMLMTNKGNEYHRDWELNLGNFTLQYFDGLTYQMRYQKFEDDDLLQEGFNEAVEYGQARFRLVDKLKNGQHCECEIEDGVLYLQTTVAKWGSNISDAAQKLLDIL